MAYIRYGTPLPSGKTSYSYVIGDPVCLMNFNPNCKPIPYPELIELFKSKTYPQMKRIIRKRLNLSAEESDVVCERLFEEHKKGEWNEVPKWSIDYIKKYGSENMMGEMMDKGKSGKENLS